MTKPMAVTAAFSFVLLIAAYLSPVSAQVGVIPELEPLGPSEGVVTCSLGSSYAPPDAVAIQGAGFDENTVGYEGDAIFRAYYFDPQGSFESILGFYRDLFAANNFEVTELKYPNSFVYGLQATRNDLVVTVSANADEFRFELIADPHLGRPADRCHPPFAFAEPDTDADGMADSVDLDDDNDTFTDVAEIAAGSNPLNAASTPAPTSAGQCKNGGFAFLTNGIGGPRFRNQGECVSFVVSNRG